MPAFDPLSEVWSKSRPILTVGRLFTEWSRPVLDLVQAYRERGISRFLPEHWNPTPMIRDWVSMVQRVRDQVRTGWAPSPYRTIELLRLPDRGLMNMAEAVAASVQFNIVQRMRERVSSLPEIPDSEIPTEDPPITDREWVEPVMPSRQEPVRASVRRYDAIRTRMDSIRRSRVLERWLVTDRTPWLRR